MEKQFTLTYGPLQIPCIHREPEYGGVRRVVLSVHGFGGSMHDQIQEGIADEMDLFCAASVRFDFPHHGESPDVGRDLSLSDCVDTLLTAAEYACGQYPELEELCVFATGFGAYVTLIALMDLIDLAVRVKLVIQTPSLRMDETVLNMKKLTKVTLEAMGRTTFRGKRPFDVTYEFYQELSENIALASYPIPFLLLHGEHDDYIPISDIQHFHGINELSKLVIIPGASHRFLEPGAWDMVLDLTRDWFEFEQVLLEDTY